MNSSYNRRKKLAMWPAFFSVFHPTCRNANKKATFPFGVDFVEKGGILANRVNRLHT
jgi:hypothetical protein